MTDYPLQANIPRVTKEWLRWKWPVHVEPRLDVRWAVIREGNKKASAVHSTGEQAEKHARNMAAKSGSEVYVNDRRGAIREHDSYEGTANKHEEIHGREVAHVLLTRPDTGAVERQVAYHDGDTWTVRVQTYPTTEESRPGGRYDPIGRTSAESERYEELSLRLLPRARWLIIGLAQELCDRTKEHGADLAALCCGVGVRARRLLPEHPQASCGRR